MKPSTDFDQTALDLFTAEGAPRKAGTATARVRTLLLR
jgi:hypothetical protein